MVPIVKLKGLRISVSSTYQFPQYKPMMDLSETNVRATVPIVKLVFTGRGREQAQDQRPVLSGMFAINQPIQ
jgi:hypothetical protein